MFHPTSQKNLDRAWSVRELALNRLLVSETKSIPRVELSAGNLHLTDDTGPSSRHSSPSPVHVEAPLPKPFNELASNANHRLVVNGREFWFSGTALLCRCPDCAAPMSVRIWLGLADCWRCGCSLELTEFELAQLQPKAISSARPPNSLPAPARAAISARFDPTRIPVAITSNPRDEREEELERLVAGTALARLVKTWFQSLPIWVVSFLFHLVLLLILAMIVLRQAAPDGLGIVLSAFIDKSRTAGGEVQLQNPEFDLSDDQPLAPDFEKAEVESREMQQALADAKELTNDPFPLSPLADLDQIRQNLTTSSGTQPSFVARDPRIRSELVVRNGGTTLTEAAVSRGLRWLASVQNKDGSWSLANYDRHARQNNPGDAAATSLALLPFLGAGQTQEFGIYKSNVAAGLAWLMQNQKSNGDLRANYPGQAGMYAHGQATIVLCEAFAMTGDEKLRGPAQAAIDFIVRAQHARGGWRYQPGEPGDTSVFGWQVMALQSARAARGGISVDKETLQLSDYFLDSVSKSTRSKLPAGALYRYLPDEGEFTPAMTAEGLLCRMYLGWKRDNPRLMAGVRWLVENHLPDENDRNIYYWYYGTQVLHHYGGREWEKWNSSVRDLLVESQEKKGRHPGSWNPEDFEWGAQGERIFVTSLAVCTLEVYYRHLPLFEKLKLDE